MNNPYRSSSLATVLTCALVVAGCGDDDPTGGGNTDTTPASVTTVTAVDATHIDVTFDEDVQRSSAEDRSNYVIVESAVPMAGTSAPGDTLVVGGAALRSDKRTVSLTTNFMLDAPYVIDVVGVKDVAGNAIVTPVGGAFQGSTAPDVTAPELVYRSPASNATNVSLGAQIVLTFSERMEPISLFSGLKLSSPSGGVPYTPDTPDGGIHVVATPNSPLALGTEYTVTLTGVEDLSGNVLPDVSWTFRTTNVVDNTPPTIVSSDPANGALNVDVDDALSITFSEALNQSVLGITAYPDLGDGVLLWSNGGKTLTFRPDVPFLDDQQYTLTALPGSYEDLSGNRNTQLTQIRFSTGASLAAGSIAGTLSGDPASDFASDPTGARVLAIVGEVVFEDLQIAGTATVAGNNTYDIRYLPDETYRVIAIMDANNDGSLDPGTGDAIGGYGVDLLMGDFEPDSVVVAGGDHVTGINFRLFDVSAITGAVAYSGSVVGSHFVGVGLFEVAGFNPNNPPDYTAEASWPDFPFWGFLNVEDGIPDGSYYVGAFLDANDNFTLDAGVDPVGFYGGYPPTAISINDGSDVNGLVIDMLDPIIAAAEGSVAWRKPIKRAMPSWGGALGAAANETSVDAGGLLRGRVSNERR